MPGCDTSCDGTIHVGRFEVDQQEPVWGSDDPKSTVYEPLGAGAGYVQLCPYDETTGADGVSSNRFRDVR